MSGDPRDVLALCRLLGRQGLAGFLPTFLCASFERMQASLEVLKRVAGSEKGARILGVHLEGPFLNPERRGTHNPRHIRPPSLREIREHVAAGEGLIRLVTLAPELPGAREVIRFLTRKGIRVSMGHSTASLAQARQAKAWGVTGVTHLCNAMNGLHHREPGLLGFALLDPDLYTEVIADGVHVSEPVLRLILKQRPERRIVLVSDSLFLSRHPKLKSATWQGLTVKRFPDGSLRRPDGTISGSDIMLRQAVARIARLGAGRRAAAAMASANPRRWLELRA
jgi:N-acetylglucosamine-6-phosphate deacetylase